MVILVTSCQAKESNTMDTTQKEQRFVELKIDSEGINYYVKINDVKVFNEVGKAPVNDTVPINHWVINGDNQLRVGVKFDDQEKAIERAKTDALTVSLMLRIKNNGESRSYTLTKYDLGISDERQQQVKEGELSFSLQDKDKLVASKSSQTTETELDKLFTDGTDGVVTTKEWTAKDVNEWTRFEQTITMNLGFPDWAYLSANDLGDITKLSDDDYYALSDELFLEYEKVWQLMKDKKLEALLPLFKPRAEELDAAFQLTPGEKLSDMERSLSSAFEHGDLYLYDLVDKENVYLTVEGHNQIAKLEFPKIFKPIIFYAHKDDAFTRFYNLYFMRKDGKWIIIR